jgi:plasmid stabilization system protein ParE
MTGKKAKALPVVYAAAARNELDEIWDWNEKTYGRRHAANYIEFLDTQIESLGTEHLKGRSVGTRPDLRYLSIKLRQRGHGHVVVYSVDQQAVNILHVFHTAQDWQNRLTDEIQQ